MKKIIILPIVAIFIILVIIGFWRSDLLLQNFWNFLVVNERPHPADVIIVLSGDTGRIEQGVMLYQDGYASKIIIAGDASRELERQALYLGVPERNILVDVNSTTTFGNAYYSAQIMRDQGFKSAIVVTSAYHTRRSTIIFSQFFRGLKFTVCASPYDSSISTSWWKNRRIEAYVVSEYIKMGYLFVVEIPFQKVAPILTYFGINLRLLLY